MPVTIERHSPLPAAEAWAAITDFPVHGAVMPATRVLTDPIAPSAPGPGWRFLARTSVGPITLDDPMVITRWNPPEADAVGLFRVDKVGPVLAGWTVVRVHPCPGGSTVVWVQHLRLRIWVPPPGETVTESINRSLYGRALDVLLAQQIDRVAAVPA